MLMVISESLGNLSLHLDQFQAPPWIILGVCIIGVFLAYSTDEHDFFLHTSAQEVQNFSVSNKTKIDESSSKKMLNDIEPVKSPRVLLSEILPVTLVMLLSRIISSLTMYKKKFGLYITAMQLKKLSTSKRHFFYLMEKKTLNLPIQKDESEIDSYLDCKRCIGAKWPFMWEISNVASNKVNCDGYDCIPMSSYSYLDLLRNKEVQDSAFEAAKKWATGNHGPRMLGGNMKILRDLEKVIAKFFNRDDTLLCATGYLACMSACAAVATESTVIFADSRIHASLKAGLKIGEAKVIYFRHNNFTDCERLVKKNRSKFLTSWMVIESVYSMDGDLCDLPKANEICKKYNIKIILDEAHGLGVVGRTGRGAEEHFNLKGCATMIVGTFSKSIASIGGYICGPKHYIDYLDFHAPGNVFSAPLPAYCAGAAIKSFEIINENSQLIEIAQKNSKRLRQLLATGANSWPSDYPESHKYILEGDESTTVIPVIFNNDIDRVIRIATKLKIAGYMCSAVAYPACPLRTPRFRITATSAYTDELMEKFTKTLVSICVEEQPSEIAQLQL